MTNIIRLIGIVLLCLSIVLPILASERIGPNKEVNKQIENELQKMTERTPQTQCPIMGGKVTENTSYNFMGHEIKTCCPDCIAKVEKDPLSAIAAIRKNGEEPVLAKGFTRQTVCPVMGGKVQDTVYKVKNNVLVKFCCPDCESKFEKEPEKTVDAMLEKKEAPIILTLAQSICPITGEPISTTSFIEKDGKKLYFCCDDCKDKFTKESKKYLQEIADAGIVLETVK